MLTKSARRNREIGKKWKAKQDERLLPEPNKCGVCRFDDTLYYKNARLRVMGTGAPMIMVVCKNCHNEVVLSYGKNYGQVFHDLYKYTPAWRKIVMALHIWLADIL